jgi:hypothetical protein
VAVLSLFHTTQGFSSAPKFSDRPHPAVFLRAQSDLQLDGVERRFLIDPKRTFSAD